MLDKIVELGANGFAVTASAEFLDRLDHLVNSALMQGAALFVQPLFASFGRPILAQRGHLVEMFDSMVEVNQAVNILTIEIQGVAQGRKPIPNPGSTIRDKEDLIGVLYLQGLQIVGQHDKEDVRPLQRTINQRSETGVLLASFIDYIDDEKCGFPPSSFVAVPSLGGLGTSLLLSQPDAPAVTADDHPSSRYAFLAVAQIASGLLGQTNSVRCSIGDEAQRFLT